MITLSVPDMSCGHCKASVESALAPLAARVDVDLSHREVKVESASAPQALIAALSDIGFPAQLVSE